MKYKLDSEIGGTIDAQAHFSCRDGRGSNGNRIR